MKYLWLILLLAGCIGCAVTADQYSQYRIKNPLLDENLTSGELAPVPQGMNRQDCYKYLSETQEVEERKNCAELIFRCKVDNIFVYECRASTP